MSADYARYALYLTPPPDSDLWRFGCDVIGRDPMASASREGFSLEGYPPDSWRSMTSDARRYGFHATLAGHGLSFVALKPEGALKELRSFEASVVRGLDRLRAPFVETGREYRGSKRLTPRQAYYLHAWGYPYVLDEFDPHFTLTNAIPDADRVAGLLEWDFGLRVASRALHADALTLFGQGEPGGEFRILRSFPLGRPHRSRRSMRALAPAVFD